MGCRKWESLFFIGCGKWEREIGLVITPAIQCSVCCCCCGTRGQKSSQIGWDRSETESRQCGQDCHLMDIVGLFVPPVTKTCSHGWRCGHMPLLGMDIGSTISSGEGTCARIQTQGSCVARRHSWPECSVVLTRTIVAFVGRTDSNVVGGLPFNHERGRPNVACQSACRLSSQWL